MDRNGLGARVSSTLSRVALRKESVDRNETSAIDDLEPSKVALRKESVDRNGMQIDGVSYDVWSLSARRAWIEIIVGVLATLVTAGRSPQGERG